MRYILSFFIYISQAHSFMRCVLPLLPCISILFILHGPFGSPDPYPSFTSAQFFPPTLFSLNLCFPEIARSFPKFWALLTPLCLDILSQLRWMCIPGKLQSYRQILGPGLAKRALLGANVEDRSMAAKIAVTIKWRSRWVMERRNGGVVRIVWWAKQGSQR